MLPYGFPFSMPFRHAAFDRYFDAMPPLRFSPVIAFIQRSRGGALCGGAYAHAFDSDSLLLHATSTLYDVDFPAMSMILPIYRCRPPLPFRCCCYDAMPYVAAESAHICSLPSDIIIDSPSFRAAATHIPLAYEFTISRPLTLCLFFFRPAFCSSLFFFFFFRRLFC